MPTGVYKRIEGKNYGCMTKGKPFWKGKKFPESTKEKHRQLMLGDKNPSHKYGTWNKGKKTGPRSLQTKLKISKWQKDNRENSHLWQGGISFLSYPVDWTNTLKISIRERDKYTCQICSEKQGDVAFDVHHIDYNKKNCNPDNLITLCRKCHVKTNGNRNYWINYFKK